MRGLVARVSVVILVPPEKLWEGLTNLEMVKLYMFGATVVTDWKRGNSIVWNASGRDGHRRTRV